MFLTILILSEVLIQAKKLSELYHKKPAFFIELCLIFVAFLKFRTLLISDLSPRLYDSLLLIFIFHFAVPPPIPLLLSALFLYLS